MITHVPLFVPIATHNAALAERDTLRAQVARLAVENDALRAGAAPCANCARLQAQINADRAAAKELLTAFKATVGPGRFPCAQCTKTFFDADALAAHVTRAHAAGEAR